MKFGSMNSILVD